MRAERSPSRSSGGRQPTDQRTRDWPSKASRRVQGRRERGENPGMPAKVSTGKRKLPEPEGESSEGFNRRLRTSRRSQRYGAVIPAEGNRSADGSGAVWNRGLGTYRERRRAGDSGGERPSGGNSGEPKPDGVNHRGRKPGTGQGLSCW